MAIVYLIIHKDSGKVYVGKTVRRLAKRWDRHCYDAKAGTGKYLHRAMLTHGIDRFDVCVIDEAPTDVEVLQLEEKYILEYRSTNPEVGYNLTTGGEGGRLNPEFYERHSAFMKQRIVDGKAAFGYKGVKLDPEMVEKRAAKQRGRPFTEAHKQAMRGIPKSRPSVPKGTVLRTDIPNDEIVRLYQEGVSTLDLALRYNTCRSTITWRLRNLGVAMKHGRRPKEMYQTVTV